MKLIDYNLSEFVKEVNSDAPAPGGGSVAAYVSCLGAGLARMLGHLSVGKKAFLDVPEFDQNQFIMAFESLEGKHQRLLELVDEDTLSFNEVMKAFKMPKETEEEKVTRKDAIANATLQATKIPFEAAMIAYECLECTPSLVEYGNKNAISDLASGMYLLEAGMNCSILNVKINVSGLADQEVATDFIKQCDQLQINARRILEDNLEVINGML